MAPAARLFNPMTLTPPVAGQTSELAIPGPAGILNARLAMPLTAAPTGIAVLCHPHPLFGGSMTNKVVTTLAATAQKQGFATLRFDFRGVGRSQGVHDGGRGETDDCLAAVDGMRRRWPGARLLLAGFSFGAFIALKAATIAKPAALFSVAPPFKYFDKEPLPSRPACPWRILHSTDDDVVAYDDTRRQALAYRPPPEWAPVEGCGHFFHGRLNDVAAALSDFLQTHWTPP